MLASYVLRPNSLHYWRLYDILGGITSPGGTDTLGGSLDCGSFVVKVDIISADENTQ